MKKMMLTAATVLLIVAACKSKKSTTASKSSEPTDAQLTAAKAKFPDVTMEQLKKGHDVFYGPCTQCHGAKSVTGYTEPELSAIMDKMSVKAMLAPDEKDAVWRYAMAVRLTAK